MEIGAKSMGNARHWKGGITTPGGVKNGRMWHLGTRVGGGLGRVEATLGLDGLEGLCQPLKFDILELLRRRS